MQVQQVRNNNLDNMNFAARLKISGAIDDISSKQLKDWSKKVQQIGSKNDVIELVFGEPMTYRRFLFERRNPNSLNKNKDRSYKQFVVRRTISTNIHLGNGQEINYKPQSYWSEFSKNINEEKQKSYHKKLTNFSVSKLLKTLKSFIEKSKNQ